MIDKNRLAEKCSTWNIALTGRQLDQLDQYAELLVSYNQKVNLTAITDPEGIEDKHFLDSLLFACQPEVTGRTGDVGAGAGVPLGQARGRAAQPRHAEAVVVEHPLLQGDGGGVLPLVVAFAAQQAVGPCVQDDRAFGPVEPELIVRQGVRLVKGHVEGRVIPDAKGQGLGGGGRVFHREGVADRLALQPEGAGQDKIVGEAGRLDLLAGAQLHPDGVGAGLQQGVLQVAGKAVLPPLVALAGVGQDAPRQLARPGEQDGRVPPPHRRVRLPEHLLPGGVADADRLRAVGVCRQSQKFVVDGRLHRPKLLSYLTHCRQTDT